MCMDLVPLQISSYQIKMFRVKCILFITYEFIIVLNVNLVLTKVQNVH